MKNIIMRILNILNIMNVVIILLYNFEKTKKIIKITVMALTNKNICESINGIYINILPILKMIMYGYFIILLLIVLYKIKATYSGRKWQRSRIKYGLKIYKVLYDYLKNDEKKCFVITGKWGVGKTYTVDYFFENYFKYENRDVYRISCFGMEKRTDVLNELKNVFEKQDNSIRKYLINVLNKIPLIGGLLEDALKSDYEFKDLREKSIFVFDDFERINIPKYSNYSDNWYTVRKMKKTPGNAFEMVYEEFKEVEKSFSRFDNSLKKIKQDIELDKMNVITGLINELIERYNMKVIVICNKEEIDSNFFNDMFEHKIESILYNINTEKSIYFNMALKSIKSRLYLDGNIQSKLENFFEKQHKIIDKIWNKSQISNIRILSKTISAFIEVIENTSIEEIMYKDLFYTIFIINIFNENNEINVLENIRIGESIKVYSDKHVRLIKDEEDYKEDFISYICSIDGMEDLRWMGLNVGLAWNIGLHEYDGFQQDIEKYNMYNYEFESEILCHNKKLLLQFDKTTYRFDDLMFYLSINARNKEIIDKILKILENGNIDYMSHTSFKYYKRSFSNIWYKENCTLWKTIFAIMNMYKIDDELSEKVFKYLRNVINKEDIILEDKHILTAEESYAKKYINYIQENLIENS